MESCLLCRNRYQLNRETNSFGEQTTVTQCYGKALINLFFSKFSRYDVVLFVCLVLLALCLVLRLLLSCIAGQGGELPRGVIDQ